MWGTYRDRIRQGFVVEKEFLVGGAELEGKHKGRRNRFQNKKNKILI